MYGVDVVIFILELPPHPYNGEIIQRIAVHSELFFFLQVLVSFLMSLKDFLIIWGIR